VNALPPGSLPREFSGWLFQRLRWQLLRNAWRVMVGHSLLRPLTIVVCSVVVWGFVFGVSLEGFHFLKDKVHLPLDEQMVGVFLGWLFLALGGLLVFSTGLILYGSLFTAAETAFLLSKPVRADHVFAYKFQGALAFSSWAFLLLGAPLLIAYGLVLGAPWFFYLVLPLYFVGYTLLPGCVGALICLLLVNFIPRRRTELLVLLIVVGVGLAGWWGYRVVADLRPATPNLTDEALTENFTLVLSRVSFARNIWVPTSWVARGLQAAGRGDLGGSSYYLALVWSNSLFLYLLTTWVSLGLYRRGFNRLSTGGDLRRRYGGTWMDRLLEALLPFVHPGTRLLIVKDFRTFRRDPQQWGQILLFTGLLVLYFTNVRRMFQERVEWNYQNGISFLNLCAIALLLCSYTGRFIYPLLSLEGRKFWILGLVPLRREQILWGKFAFSTTGGLLLSEVLIVLSDVMLEMPIDALLLHVLTVGVLAAGLSGLSVGLGACMPNFRESDPSKIAVGFGGTLNLVAGLLFLLVTVGLMAGPWHLFNIATEMSGSRSPFMIPTLIVLTGAGMVFGALAVVLPLRAGVRALREMEF
jgi:ABC-2 type transport system permease protein